MLVDPPLTRGGVLIKGGVLKLISPDVFRVRPPSIFEDLDLEATDLVVTDLVFDIFPKHPFLDVLAKFKIFFENISENSLKIFLKYIFEIYFENIFENILKKNQNIFLISLKRSKMDVLGKYKNLISLKSFLISLKNIKLQ